jgi:hypothetical protein
MDTELRYTCGLKLHRTDVAEGPMQPLPIVEHLDDLKDGWVTTAATSYTQLLEYCFRLNQVTVVDALGESGVHRN